MAIISFPADARIRSINWELSRPSQAHVSEYTGRRVVMADPWHGRWRATFDLAPVVGQKNFLAWRAFMAALKGRVNTFRLPASEGPQRASVNATASAASAGARSISLWGGSVVAGDFMTINDQMVVAITGGSAPVFEPPLRAAVTAGTSVEISEPWCLVSLSDSRVAWNVEIGQLYGASISVEEAY